MNDQQVRTMLVLWSEKHLECHTKHAFSWPETS